MSNETKADNIYTALCRAQRNYKPLKKSAENTHFKSRYSTLADVLEACGDALNAEGIAYFWRSEENELGRREVFVLMHGESGTFTENPISVFVGRGDMQGLKSGITYARRIGAEGGMGVAPEEDDDGNAAAASVKSNPTKEGLRDAWRDSVLDSLPATATDREKAIAFARVIADEFRDKGTLNSTKALENAWERHKLIIGGLKEKHPDLFQTVQDAYENRFIELSPSESEAIPGA